MKLSQRQGVDYGRFSGHYFSFLWEQKSIVEHKSKPHTGTTRSLRHAAQLCVPVRELVTVCVWGCVAMRVRWSSAWHVVAKIMKCSKIYFQGVTTCHDEVYMRDIGCRAFREHFVTDAWQIARQTVRHIAVFSDFVALKWHDLVRHIAGRCGNKIRADVRLA